jgi:hypothetical protein
LGKLRWHPAGRRIGGLALPPSCSCAQGSLHASTVAAAQGL